MMKPDDKPQSKQTLYQIASRHSKTAINRLVELMYSKNESVALGACKVLLNKSIPDLRSETIRHEESVKPIMINISEMLEKAYGGNQQHLIKNREVELSQS